MAIPKRNCRVRKGIEGLDPDQAEDYRLRKWLSDHPEMREMARDEREKAGRGMAVARA